MLYLKLILTWFLCLLASFSSTATFAGEDKQRPLRVLIIGNKNSGKTFYMNLLSSAPDEQCRFLAPCCDEQGQKYPPRTQLNKPSKLHAYKRFIYQDDEASAQNIQTQGIQGYQCDFSPELGDVIFIDTPGLALEDKESSCRVFWDTVEECLSQQEQGTLVQDKSLDAIKQFIFEQEQSGKPLDAIIVLTKESQIRLNETGLNGAKRFLNLFDKDKLKTNVFFVCNCHESAEDLTEFPEQLCERVFHIGSIPLIKKFKSVNHVDNVVLSTQEENSYANALTQCRKLIKRIFNLSHPIETIRYREYKRNIEELAKIALRFYDLEKEIKLLQENKSQQELMTSDDKDEVERNVEIIKKKTQAKKAELIALQDKVLQVNQDIQTYSTDEGYVGTLAEAELLEIMIKDTLCATFQFGRYRQYCSGFTDDIYRVVNQLCHCYALQDFEKISKDINPHSDAQKKLAKLLIQLYEAMEFLKENPSTIQLTQLQSEDKILSNEDFKKFFVENAETELVPLFKKLLDYMEDCLLNKKQSSSSSSCSVFGVPDHDVTNLRRNYIGIYNQLSESTESSNQEIYGKSPIVTHLTWYCIEKIYTSLNIGQDLGEQACFIDGIIREALLFTQHYHEHDLLKLKTMIHLALPLTDKKPSDVGLPSTQQYIQYGVNTSQASAAQK